MKMNRRDFVKLSSMSAATSLIPARQMAFAFGRKPILGRVVIIGGGYAGATAAKYLRMWSMGTLEVIVVEANQQFVSCPLSNLVLGGSKSIDELTFGYETLQKNHGIQWVHDKVTTLDLAAKKVIMQRGELNYDRLVIAPGIDFIYDAIPMLQSHEAQQKIPHAWKAGWQTVNLRQQLEAMPDGGVFVMHIPKAPYRCPPGPYERASQVASYLKVSKPKSKVIVLDANPDIVSKTDLFHQVFKQDYARLIDYRPNQAITEVDVVTNTIKTDFDEVKANVMNVIPPQRAGKIAQMAHLNNIDARWCEVDFLTYESKVASNVHVIGDAISAALPKSAHMASNQAKICANAIVQLMAGLAPDPTPVFSNTCYSYVNADSAMHIANVYRYDVEKKMMVSAKGGGVSTSPSHEEAVYANDWANNIWSDTLT
jgi:sulfide dehydrogenase [flavocytochrome c] flavoprotein subunit